MRYPASEKLEIIRQVEQSHLSAKQTLDLLGTPRTTFCRPSRRMLCIRLTADSWGWFCLSTILDDYSRHVIAWRLCSTIKSSDVTATLEDALVASGCDSATVARRPRLTEKNAGDLFSAYDVVLDGTDNFPTRRLVNRTCVEQEKPLVSVAISQWEGQVTLIDPANGTPCFECIFPNEPANGLAPNCAEGGVIGALPGVVGSIMALEAIKLIVDAGKCLKGEMLLFDGLWSESRKIRLTKSKECPVCSKVVEKTTCPA